MTDKHLRQAPEGEFLLFQSEDGAAISQICCGLLRHQWLSYVIRGFVQLTNIRSTPLLKANLLEVELSKNSGWFVRKEMSGFQRDRAL